MPARKAPDLRVINGYTELLCHRGHTGHDDFATGIVFIPELLYGAEPAGPNRMQGRVPAEVRDVESQIKTGMKEVACPPSSPYMDCCQ